MKSQKRRLNAFFFLFTKLDQMSRVGSWGRHAGCRPKKTHVTILLIFSKVQSSIYTTLYYKKVNLTSFWKKWKDDKTLWHILLHISSTNKCCNYLWLFSFYNNYYKGGEGGWKIYNVSWCVFFKNEWQAVWHLFSTFFKRFFLNNGSLCFIF